MVSWRRRYLARVQEVSWRRRYSHAAIKQLKCKESPGIHPECIIKNGTKSQGNHANAFLLAKTVFIQNF
ncbi:unnamed protein product [Rodentolepis nana]|uniref:Uncharacterized protein n=1 Tax=Rodentolepis nana TaxID=102285 RepID=A0A0R3TEA0_RODNA|nr:unnamed protein product [Rodentolepis nana]